MMDLLPMSWEDYTSCDAIALAELVAAGQVTPAELASQAQAAVVKMNPAINAVIEVFADAIKDPDKTGMNASGPLYGVPLMMKDLGSAMQGRLQETGYAWKSSCIAETDDPLTKNFRSAGFNLIGRTTTPEDGMAAVTETIKFGTTRNPWNLNYSSGGSSGGSSAAVAAGILPACSASDGGGSIRLPACWTGLVGLKVTRGRLPLPHGWSEATVPSGVEGVVTRTVRDTAAIHDAVSRKPLGSGFMPYPKGSLLLPELSVAPRQLRIAVSTGNWSRSDNVPREYRERTTAVATWLQAQGHVVEEVMDADICNFEQLFEGYKIGNWVIPLGYGIPATATALGVTLSSENTSRQALQTIEAAQSLTVNDMAAAQHASAVTTRQWGMFWERGFDLLLTPTLADRCPQVGSDYALSSTASFDEFFAKGQDLCRYTMPGNDTGLPAISLPAGVDINGLPLGVQFHAPWTMEHNLIHIAGQLESGKPEWFNQLASHNVIQI